MKARKAAVVMSVMVMAGLSFGCGKKETPQQEAQKPEAPAASAVQPQPSQPAQPGQQLALVKFGPVSVVAGKGFNVQPNGQSAMWAEAENVSPSTVIVLNNVQLKSSPKKTGKAITALVPEELYKTKGEYPVFLLDTKTNHKSNELKFVVK